jgi:hypothetical protein
MDSVISREIVTPSLGISFKEDSALRVERTCMSMWLDLKNVDGGEQDSDSDKKV